ncbi:unnamed protein product [Closterium sp. Naga37s-1]|nr:unnamed protein product [Closterium sp. Naga37s-1]
MEPRRSAGTLAADRPLVCRPSVSHGTSQRAAAAARSGHAEWEFQAGVGRREEAGWQWRSLAVGLLAAAVSGARDAMKVARGLDPSDGAAPGGVAGAAGQQRKGARILAAETFAHHEPLPGYLDHIPRRQALATCTQRCSPPLPLFPSLVPSLCCFFFSQPVSALLVSHFSAPFASHSPAPFASHSPAPVASHSSAPVASSSVVCLVYACGRTTVTIRSQYLGPYDLHNDIYNMTFYNGCAYNVTSPLRVWQCFNFGNVWEGILDNPDPNPSQYQQGEIFVQTTPGYCEMRMNRGASGTLQMLPGETVNIVYAYLWDFRPCVQELRFGNGNSYSMTNTTECQLAQTI